MRWEVFGADRETGDDRSIIIEADSKESAIRRANRQGLMVSTAEPTELKEPEPSLKLVFLLAISCVVAIATGAYFIWPRTSAIAVAPPPENSATSQSNAQRPSVPVQLVRAATTLSASTVPTTRAAIVAVPHAMPTSVPVLERVEKFGNGRASIGGGAWIVKNDGSSNLLRGLRVSILSPVCSAESAIEAVNLEAAEFDNAQSAVLDIIAGLKDNQLVDYSSEIKSDKELADEFKKSAELLRSFESGVDKAGKRQKHARIEVIYNTFNLSGKLELAKINRGMAQLASHAGLGWQYVEGYPHMEPIIADARIAETITRADGQWRITGITDGEFLIYAKFDSPAIYLEWLIPVKVSNGVCNAADLDLFNDNATILRNR